MKPTFRLFRSTSPANRRQYAGMLGTPGRETYGVCADLSECDTRRGEATFTRVTTSGARVPPARVMNRDFSGRLGCAA